jgi:hypothetical protein
MKCNKIALSIAVGISIFSIGGCSVVKTEQYQDQQPIVTIQDFFSGHVTGYGMVQDRSGKVNQRFVVEMHGKWNGDKGTLNEDFVFADGHIQKREWTFTRVDDHHFTGTAADVVGEAECEQFGNAIHMKYVLQIPVGKKTYAINMDDWLYGMDKKVILNRTSMTKFGFSVGSITATFLKHD